MSIGEVKKALNRTVRFRDAEYVLTGCIIRLDPRSGSFFYQAELTDTTTGKSIVIARLEEVHI